MIKSGIMMHRFDSNILQDIRCDFHTSLHNADLLKYDGILVYVSLLNDFKFGTDDSLLMRLAEFERDWLDESSTGTYYIIKGVQPRDAVLLKCAFYYRKGMILSMYADEKDEAYEAFKEHFAYQVKVSSNTKITANRSVYSFRPLSEYCISDLLNRTITVVSPHVMNDPFDTLLFEWIKNKADSNDITSQLYSQSAKYIRIRSFVTPRTKRSIPFQNTLMWAHYADKHSGICIKYSLSPSIQEKREQNGYRILKEVIYPKGKDCRINIKGTTINGETALLYKSRDWSYEHEVRLLTYYTDSELDYYPIVLDSDSYVEAIYFGLRCSQEMKNAIMKIFENDTRIIFYQMMICPENIYSLRAEKIKRNV